MDLVHWQDRLERHFSHLRDSRSSDPESHPVFALEHGLDSAEIEDLQSEIRRQAKRGPPSRSHRLAWIVYATELGYAYEGHEYWQTFEKSTPGWMEHGDRNWLRDCFFKFRNEYNGVTPTGKWADHFTIICWPITHAILPSDLQSQLARVLYRIRHRFDSDLLHSADRLGEAVAQFSHDTTSRFQNLVQHPFLVGWVAKALLFQEEHKTGGVILPAALERIVADLERTQRARHWLKGAADSARDTTVRGLRRRAPAEWREASALDQDREIVVNLGIEPDLVLRPVSEDAWDVLLRIRDLSPLIERFPEVRQTLTESRCTVAGSSGRPLARRRVLYPGQQIQLRRWPSPDRVLLSFDRPCRILEGLLRTECLLRRGPIWIFRITADGNAHEIRTLRVRPGCEYIVLSKAPVIAQAPLTSPTSVTCDGVHAAHLRVPDPVSARAANAISELGLQQARAIDFWPAGLVPKSWDGEGQCEWLSVDQPCIAMRCDHELGEILLELDADPAQTIRMVPDSRSPTVFLRFPQLPPGKHQLVAYALPSQQSEAQRLGQLDLLVRPPRPWTGGVAERGGLVPMVDPETPSLQDVWEGRAQIALCGPPSHSVHCVVSLFQTSSGSRILKRGLPPLPLPVDSTLWRGHFRQHIADHPDAQNAYDRAGWCTLGFTADELGSFVMRCEREFTPIRWAYECGPHQSHLRLLDDRGSDQSIHVCQHEFETPDRHQELRVEPEQPLTPNPKGGMYVAQCESYQSAIIVPPSSSRLTSFADLGVQPKLTPRNRTVSDVMELLALMDLWSRSRLVGDLRSLLKQRDVLMALATETFGLLAGARWRAAESQFADTHGPTDSRLKSLAVEIPARYGRGSLGAVLTTDCPELARRPIQARVDALARHVSRANIVRHARSLVEFALRMASCPQSLRDWGAEADRESAVRSLLEAPTIAKAARLVIMGVDLCIPSRPIVAGLLYNGWEW